MARPKTTRNMNDYGVNRSRMDDLDDHMLTQILLRLPNCVTVLVCTAVNKRWCSLISDHNFSVQFIDHKKKTTTLLKGSGFDHEDNDQPPWSFIPTMQYREEPLITEFVFGLRKLSLEYLPFDDNMITRATFKDLVLYTSRETNEEDSRVYYITNPLTKQWVALPPCPRIFNTRTALICQPPYGHTRDYKFRVVEVPQPYMDSSLDTIELAVYCSEIGEWKEINLRVPKEAGPHWLNILEPKPVVCNGIVYFNSGLCLVALDPFEVNASSDTTLVARVMPPLPDLGYLLESSGQLLAVHATMCGSIGILPNLPYRKDGTDIELEMVVSKLDLNQAPLMWETTFKGLCKGTGNSIESPHRTSFEGRIYDLNIGVHPYNDKLIYMYLESETKTVLCDTRTRCITSSERLPNNVRAFHRLEHQWWPTSVPTLVQCLPDSQ